MSSRPPISPDVPEPHRSLATETGLILSDSPRASAALSRRCLQQAYDSDNRLCRVVHHRPAVTTSLCLWCRGANWALGPERPVFHIGTNWTGERLLDWTGTNSNIRYYGTNVHHDTVWTASSTGTVNIRLPYRMTLYGPSYYLGIAPVLADDL
jgi:hypothetical protein